MKLETHVSHGILRVCTKFGENQTIGGAINTLDVTKLGKHGGHA